MYQILHYIATDQPKTRLRLDMENTQAFNPDDFELFGIWSADPAKRRNAQKKLCAANKHWDFWGAALSGRKSIVIHNIIEAYLKSRYSSEQLSKDVAIKASFNSDDGDKHTTVIELKAKSKQDKLATALTNKLARDLWELESKHNQIGKLFQSVNSFIKIQNHDGVVVFEWSPALLAKLKQVRASLKTKASN
jgi:hypothetical protein